jgi:putative transposase
MTPADVHYGRTTQISAARREVLDAAYAARPERFVRKPPEPPALAHTTWINPTPDTGRRLSTFSMNVSRKG